MHSNTFLVAQVLLFALFSVAATQFVPAVPYSWKSEIEIEGTSIGASAPIPGTFYNSFSEGMNRADLKYSGYTFTQIKRNYSEYNIQAGECSKVSPVVCMDPFWWVGLTTYTGYDSVAQCSKYAIDMGSFPGSPNDDLAVGCFYNAETPAYAYVQAKDGSYRVKVHFIKFWPGPQPISVFKLPSSCPPLESEKSQALAIAQKFLSGDFSFFLSKK